MHEVEVSEKAIADLEDIYVFGIFQFGYVQARKYFDEIFFELHKLGKSPYLGRPKFALGENIHLLVHKSNHIL